MSSSFEQVCDAKTEGRRFPGRASVLKSCLLFLREQCSTNTARLARLSLTNIFEIEMNGGVVLDSHSHLADRINGGAMDVDAPSNAALSVADSTATGRLYVSNAPLPPPSLRITYTHAVPSLSTSPHLSHSIWATCSPTIPTLSPPRQTKRLWPPLLAKPHKPSSTSCFPPAKSSPLRRACTSFSPRPKWPYPAKSPFLRPRNRPSGSVLPPRRVSRTRSATATRFTTKRLATGYPSGVTRARTKRPRAPGLLKWMRKRRRRLEKHTMRELIAGTSAKSEPGETQGSSAQTKRNLESLVFKLGAMDFEGGG